MREQGLDEAMAEINEFVAGVEGNAQAGLWEAGLKLQARAQEELTASIVSGNLHASGYVRNAQNSTRVGSAGLVAGQYEPVPTDALPAIGVELGFTANYALWVHENMEGRSPKYLEKPILNNVADVIAIVKHWTGGE